MRRRVLALVVVTTLVATLPSSAIAAGKYCGTNQVVKQKSNMPAAGNRIHMWEWGGNYYDSGWSSSAGWRTTTTGRSVVSDHFYVADNSVTYYAAYCFQLPQ